MCCETGQSDSDYTYTYDGWLSSEYRNFCTKTILVGDLCDSYYMCESVAHAVMTSLLERYRCWGTDLPLGAACMSDDMCSSKVCRDGICVVVDQPLGSNCSKYD